MTVRRYKIGDTVTWIEADKTLTGEVVTLRNHGERQNLIVRIPGEGARALLVHLQTGVDGVSFILPPPATIDEAMALAEALIEGKELRLPVNQQLHILATGLLSLVSRSEGGQAHADSKA